MGQGSSLASLLGVLLAAFVHWTNAARRTQRKGRPAARHLLRFSLHPGLAREHFARFASSYAVKVLGKPSLACPFAACGEPLYSLARTRIPARPLQA